LNYRRILIAVILLLLLFIIVKYAFPLFMPFIFGLIVAGLIEPEVRWLETHFGWPRRYAALTILALVIVAFLVLIFIIFNSLYREVNDLIRDLPKITKWSAAFTDKFNYFQRLFPKTVLQAITAFIHEITSLIPRLSSAIINKVSFLPTLIGNLIIAFISSYFFARDKGYWLSLLRNILPESWMTGLRQVGNSLYKGIICFVRLESFMMIISFVITGLVLSLLKCQRAWLIGLFVGMMEPMPMIGPGAVLLPWAGWLLVTGQWQLAVFILGLACLLIFLRQWMELRLLGEDLGVHPLFTLVGMYLGLKFFGVIGLIIAPLGLSVLSSFKFLLDKNGTSILDRRFNRYNKVTS
jgi:sporulation integral membrane protein YtvI